MFAKTVLYGWFGLVGILAAGCAKQEPAPELAASEMIVPPLRYFGGIGGDFSLTDHNGVAFRLAHQQAKAVLLFFGYTFCPDVCPLTMSKIAQVYDRLAVGPEKLLTVFVSLDPQRDTPQVLKEYLGYFSVGAVGLSGSTQAVARVVEVFGAQYNFREAAGDGYLVNHSTGTYLLDANKAVRFLFDHQDSPKKMAAVIQSLFDEQEKGGPMSGSVTADTSLIFAILRNLGVCGVCPPGGVVEDEPFWFVGNQAVVAAAADKIVSKR